MILSLALSSSSALICSTSAPRAGHSAPRSHARAARPSSSLPLENSHLGRSGRGRRGEEEQKEGEQEEEEQAPGALRRDVHGYDEGRDEGDEGGGELPPVEQRAEGEGGEHPEPAQELHEAAKEALG